MKRPLIIVIASLVLIAGGGLVWWLTRSIHSAAATAPVSQAAADRAEKKLAQITQNASLKTPAPLVTALSEEEVNSYFQYKMGTKTPKGVSNVRFSLHKDRVSGTAIVDFDQVKAAQKKPVNALLDQLLSGVKPVAGAGTFTSRNGAGLFHLEEVSVGNVGLSGFLLDLLIRHFVQPRYPRAAIDRPFELGYSIDRLVLDEGRVTVYQK